MIITKTALPRRTVLRGAGAALSLPLLDAMAPALSGAPKPIPRMAFFYTANGLHMPSFRPKAEGPGFELPQMLGGFAPVRDQLVIVSGTSNLMAS
ncbi:MAG: DUF1552 domain-containing protein, partial [Alphaproteobacteria bacterium]|nr:DUF1552 domain-containing protein [Alphaproteobacteria bacterium]